MADFKVLQGDCREMLKTLTDSSVDSVVTDPPYELGFMGKGWDRSGIAYDVEVWRECLRVLKPGAHLLAFGGSRTYHRLACAIEDAGFEIRDQIQWIYGSGFPKSLDVSKAIDAAAGAEREIVGRKQFADGTFARVTQNLGTGVFNDPESRQSNLTVTAPATDAAKQWNGWGTALKPAHEPIVLARKPLIGTVAENVLHHCTGGLNIDGCRVQFQGDGDGEWTSTPGRGTQGKGDKGTTGIYGYFGGEAEPKDNVRYDSIGRWPANVIHDGSEDVLAGFPETQSGTLSGQQNDTRTDGTRKGWGLGGWNGNHLASAGSAARFFYCAKASKGDREDGLNSLPLRSAGEVTDRQNESDGLNSPRAGAGRTNGSRNHHPTVKPTELMRYLCRLITPPKGTVLDPFCGSGSTGRGAVVEKFNFIGIELSPEYCQLARLRINAAVDEQGTLFD